MELNGDGSDQWKHEEMSNDAQKKKKNRWYLARKQTIDTTKYVSVQSLA